MPDAAKFRQTLSVLYRRFNALQRDEKRCFGVTLSQCVTVEVLHEAGPQPMRELAARLGVDTSTVTRVVDVLERDGLVRRTRDAQRDSRRVFVSLTEAGRRLARRLEACADAYCERILARIPGERREDVLHALGVLCEAIEQWPAACGPGFQEES